MNKFKEIWQKFEFQNFHILKPSSDVLDRFNYLTRHMEIQFDAIKGILDELSERDESTESEIKKMADEIANRLKSSIIGKPAPSISIEVDGKLLDPECCQEIIDSMEAEEKRQAECEHFVAAEGIAISIVGNPKRFVISHQSFPHDIKYDFKFCPLCGADLSDIPGGGA